jgi:hypothetical protein
VKRDMELLRSILLKFEAESPANTFKINEPNAPEGVAPDIFVAHCALLRDAGFIKHKEDLIGRKDKTCEITWEGFEFLDTVRDPEIWRKTREAAEKARGFTVEILQDLAKGFIKTQLMKLTGVEVLK